MGDCEVEIRKDRRAAANSHNNSTSGATPSENSYSSGSRSTMSTSMSTLLSSGDPQDVFHHSITDLESFSNSLDMNSHLPSATEREAFLATFMDEEEINPHLPNEQSFQSSFEYDLDCSIPTRLGTIWDDFTESEEEQQDGMPVDSLTTSPHRATDPTATKV